ncbi:MAG: acyl-ACP thioesterase domain-containing protein [Myxococcota bacterium]
MTHPVFEMNVTLPRHAFSPREVARPLEVWRAFQDVAVEASRAAGWPPERYREVGTSFVVRAMRVVHHREVRYGEVLRAESWVSSFRGRVFSIRELRLFDDAGPVADATQDWVHVTTAPSAGKPEGSQRLRPLRAGPEMANAFPIHQGRPSVVFPEDPVEAEVPVRDHFDTELGCWHTWMDPLAHVNHPQYVAFCDEALSRELFQRGHDPVRLRALAEEVTFQNGVRAPERVHVKTERRGAIFAHEISTAAGIAAKARTRRGFLSEEKG